nr:hypothetical protein [uncultured Cohaesibacter sp.]
MQRRTFVIPFERKFETNEQQTDLFEMIWSTERAGVLNRFLDGYLRFEKRGCKFDEPEDCIFAKKKFFTESNPLRAFISDKCADDPNAKIRLSFIREAFKTWAKENDFSASSIAGHKLKRNMELLGYEIVNMNGYPYVRGITLKKEGS